MMIYIMKGDMRLVKDIDKYEGKRKITRLDYYRARKLMIKIL